MSEELRPRELTLLLLELQQNACHLADVRDAMKPLEEERDRLMAERLALVQAIEEME